MLLDILAELMSVPGLFAHLGSCRQRNRKNESQLKSVPPAMQAFNRHTSASEGTQELQTSRTLGGEQILQCRVLVRFHAYRKSCPIFGFGKSGALWEWPCGRVSYRCSLGRPPAVYSNLRRETAVGPGSRVLAARKAELGGHADGCCVAVAVWSHRSNLKRSKQ